MASWAMDESSSLGIWPDPKSLGLFFEMGGVGFVLFLPQVSHQNRVSGAEPWGGVRGQPERWLKLGS